MIINAVRYNHNLYFLTEDVMYAIQNESALATGVVVVIETSDSAPDPQNYIEYGCQAPDQTLRVKFIQALSSAPYVQYLDAKVIAAVDASFMSAVSAAEVFDFPAAPAAGAHLTENTSAAQKRAAKQRKKEKEVLAKTEAEQQMLGPGATAFSAPVAPIYMENFIVFFQPKPQPDDARNTHSTLVL